MHVDLIEFLHLLASIEAESIVLMIFVFLLLLHPPFCRVIARAAAAGISFLNLALALTKLITVLICSSSIFCFYVFDLYLYFCCSGEDFVQWCIVFRCRRRRRVFCANCLHSLVHNLFDEFSFLVTWLNFL